MQDSDLNSPSLQERDRKGMAPDKGKGRFVILITYLFNEFKDILNKLI
jgi:hypothetical protein